MASLVLPRPDWPGQVLQARARRYRKSRSCRCSNPRRCSRRYEHTTMMPATRGARLTQMWQSRPARGSATIARDSRACGPTRAVCCSLETISVDHFAQAEGARGALLDRDGGVLVRVDGAGVGTHRPISAHDRAVRSANEPSVSISYSAGGTRQLARDL